MTADTHARVDVFLLSAMTAPKLLSSPAQLRQPRGVYGGSVMLANEPRETAAFGACFCVAAGLPKSVGPEPRNAGKSLHWASCVGFWKVVWVPLCGIGLGEREDVQC